MKHVPADLQVIAIIRLNKPHKEFCQRLLDKSKAKKLAVVSVMEKLLKRVDGVLKHNKPFDSDYKT